MARLDETFDATDIDPLQPFENLPAGTYRAQIVESEMRATRNGQGQYLWLMLDILEGAYQGRKLFDQLNLINPNPQTVEMAKRSLSAICHATGRIAIADSEELHLMPMEIVVTVEPPKNGYGARNRIRYVAKKKDAGTANPPARPTPAAAPVATPMTAQQSEPSTPWRHRG